MRRPRIAIVGRPNVGKSSLFNTLVRRPLAIVDDFSGVTRDRISAAFRLPEGTAGQPERPALIIDTGGYGIDDVQDLTADVERQIAHGVAEADVLLLILDTRTGVVALDATVAQRLREAGGVSWQDADKIAKGAKPVIVVSNKVDDDAHEVGAWAGGELGFGEPVPMSAKTRRNHLSLTDALHAALAALPADALDGPDEDELHTEYDPDLDEGFDDDTDDGLPDEDDLEPLPEEDAPDDDAQTTPQVGRPVLAARERRREAVRQAEGVRIAIVGKRNAGKSTLVNALAGAPRVIVSEKAGTTRDSVDVVMRFELQSGGTQKVTLIDTAGVRKRKSLTEDLEYYAQHRSLRSVRRADACLLLIDASLPVSQVDHQLVGEIQKHHVPTAIVVNKWDLAEKNYTTDEYGEYLEKTLRGLDFAPVVFTSALHGDAIKEALAMALELDHQAGQRASTSEVNDVIDKIMAERGPATNKHGKRAKIYYAAQLAVRPPTLGLFVNDPDLFDPNYRRFLLNRLRDHMPYPEVPIRLLVRPRRSLPKSARQP
ncbi:MAG: ribosome biogenesis GTPase Der [Planctomycetota bacterium]